jgi:GST-like protein
VTDVIAPSHAGFFLQGKGLEVGPALFSQLVIERVEHAETFVTASPYMAGDEFSIADIVAVTIIDSVQNELEWDRYPMLRDWFDGVIRRPSVRRAFSAFGT